MKLNRLKETVIALLLVFVVQSCSEDFLDEVNPNEEVDQTFWTTGENAESAVASIYSPLRGQMYGYFGAFTGFQTMNRGDDLQFIPGEEPHNVEPVTYTNTPETEESDFGRLYLTVNRANVFLNHIDDVEEIDEDKKQELISEVHFLRGFAYFLLVTNYGDVPLRTKSSSDEPDEEMKESSPEEDVWAFVIEEFKEAKKNLPVERSSDELGRATKGTAKAYLGKSYVWTENYTEAEKELGDLLKSPYNYDLVENYEDNFNENTEFNKEYVFEFNYDATFGGDGIWAGEGGTQGGILAQFAGSDGTGSWTKFFPSPSIIKHFTQEERHGNASTRFDKRMYGTLMWKYSDYESGLTDGKWFGDKDFDEFWDDSKSSRERYGSDGLNLPDIDGKEGRFLNIKFTNFYKNEDDANSMYDASNRNNNLRVMRFAEVLLLHAEAAIKNGNLGKAEDDLNRIRERAGLKEKSWNSEDELWKEMMHQNELEFAFEGHRFFDLKRWYGQDMKQVLEENEAQGADNFQPKNLYLPIPQGEIDTNEKLEQHPMWQ